MYLVYLTIGSIVKYLAKINQVIFRQPNVLLFCLALGYNHCMKQEKKDGEEKPAARLRAGDADARKQAAALMGSATTPKKAASSAANGKLGGKRMTPMSEINCTCGAGDVTVSAEGKPLHPTTCPRGRVIRYRLTKGLPLT